MKKTLLIISFLISHITNNAQSLSELVKDGFAKLAESNFEAAEQSFASAIRVNEPVIKSYLDKLKKYNAMNEYQRSVSDTPDGFVYNHDYALPYYGHGMALESLNKQDAALADYEKAISIDPKYVDAICQHGITLISKGDKAKGCIDLEDAKTQGSEKAKELFEKNACHNASGAFITTGNSKFDAKDYAEALKDYSYAIQLNADSAEAYIKRAQCNVALKKYTNAILDYNKALELKADTIKTLYLRGLAFLNAKRFQESFDDFSTLIKKTPNEYNNYMQRAAVCEGMTNFVSAVYDYSEAIRIKPQDATAYYKRAVAKQDAKDNTYCKDLKMAASLGNEEAKAQAQYCQ